MVKKVIVKKNNINTVKIGAIQLTYKHNFVFQEHFTERANTITQSYNVDN